MSRLLKRGISLIKEHSKLRWIAPSGDSCQDSIRNDVFNLEEKIVPDDIVSLIMSVTPLFSDDVIDDSIRVCKNYGYIGG